MNTVTLTPSGRLSFGEVRKNFKPRFVPRSSASQRMRNESIEIIGASQYDPMRILKSGLLGLSNVSNSEKTPGLARRAKRGSGGITGHGRLLVKDAATWLQKEYGKERLAFWTLTIPPECLTEGLLSQWAKVTDLLRHKLTYHLRKHALPEFFVGVTEIQAKRWERERDLPPLHLHILFVAAKDRFVPLLHKTVLDKIWCDVLENFTGERPALSNYCQVQFIKKDAAGYLAKYLSKGSIPGLEMASHLVPSSWYFCSKPLRLLIKGLIVKHSGEWVNDLYEYFRRYGQAFNFAKEVVLTFSDGQQIKVGWYGQLKGDYYDHVWQIIRDCANACQGRAVFPVAAGQLF